MVLLAVVHVGCSPTTPGGDAAPEFRYFSECSTRRCDPQIPAEEALDGGEKSCRELGIFLGDPCRDDVPTCVGAPPIRDIADGGTCRVPAVRVVCTSETVFCPASTASVKKHIEYLTPAEVSEAAREIRDLPLVRYRYKTQGDGVTPTVGIIIEDVPGASFVDHESQRVNLYSFVSATAAAYQAQAKELEELKARLAAVEAKCGQTSASPVPLAPSSIQGAGKAPKSPVGR